MLIFEIFERVPDPRKANHSFQHRFLDVLCIALCATLSGAESFVDMEDYGLSKETWLRERLGLELPLEFPVTTPSTDSFPCSIPKPLKRVLWHGHSICNSLPRVKS